MIPGHDTHVQMFIIIIVVICVDILSLLLSLLLVVVLVLLLIHLVATCVIKERLHFHDDTIVHSM